MNNEINKLKMEQLPDYEKDDHLNPSDIEFILNHLNKERYNKTFSYKENYLNENISYTAKYLKTNDIKNYDKFLEIIRGGCYIKNNYEKKGFWQLKYITNYDITAKYDTVENFINSYPDNIQLKEMNKSVLNLIHELECK